MILISLILATSPSTTLNVKLTLLRSIGVKVVVTSTAYILRAAYCCLRARSALSANALSKGCPSDKPISRNDLISASLSNSLVPENSTLAMVGRSSTITINTPSLASIRTSLNKPKANRERMASEPFPSS